MAVVEAGRVSVQVGDSAGKLSSASFNVTAAAAKAWVDAADQAARDATAAGTLLATALAISRASASTDWKQEEGCKIAINDTFAYPATSLAQYNSNKWAVKGMTDNAGFPSIDTVYVPQYLITGVVMESDGVSALLSDAPVSAFVTAFLATALSKFYTPFTSVISIKRNDS